MIVLDTHTWIWWMSTRPRAANRHTVMRLWQLPELLLVV